MDTDNFEKLDIEDVEGVTGGENFYDAVHNVYWDIFHMKQTGKTKEETYAYCEERYAAFLPYIEEAIQNYLTAIYTDPTIVPF